MRELALAGGRQSQSRAAETHALEAVASWPFAPGACAGEAYASVLEQAGHRPSLAVEGELRRLLAIPTCDLGANFSPGLVWAGHAQPTGAYAQSRPHVARARGTHLELVSG